MVDVGLIDARIGADEAEPVPDDEHPGPFSHHGRGFVEDQLHQAWIFLGLRCQRDSFGGRRDVGKSYQAALGLGNDLLRDDQHVAATKRCLAVDGVHEDGAEIIAGPNQG